jgi:uncharacterized small protein (DUF1192 family)
MILRGHPLARAALAVLAALALLACASPEPSRQLYQWTDADGNVRYTPFPDSVPVARRSTRRVVEPGTDALAEPARPLAPEVAVAPTAPGASASGPPDGGSELDARIAALESQIAVDEEALKTMISDPAQAGALRDSDALREIAERMPALQAELARLRAERDGAPGQGTGPTGSAADEPAGGAGDAP